MARHPIDQYAWDVTHGHVPAGKYHRLACERHLLDRSRENTDAFPYVFDAARADRFLRFGEQLKHYKGEWAGQFIRWQPHQQFRLGSLFAWVHHKTGERRIRNSYNELPRKQGKSLEDAVVAIYVTFFDGEPGAEGYCAATKRDQAKIVFNDCRRLVLNSDALSRRLGVLTHNLHHDASASKLEPLGADEDSTDGLNPNFVSLDELHAMKTRGMIDVLETATGARRQPLVFKITTAGADPASPCGEEHAYACAILERTLIDESYFAFIAHADPEDDWTLESTARKANPNYGISVKPDDLRNKVTKAIGMPGAAAAYKQKHLNLWVNASEPWLSLEGWRAGQLGPDVTALRGQACFVGIDLASKLDLLAMVALFPPTAAEAHWRTRRWVWTPKDTVKNRARRDRAPYEQWIEQGWLIAVPGTRVDHQVVRDALAALAGEAAIAQIGFDPWHADQLISQLTTADGFAEDQVVEVSQTYAGMSSGCKDCEAAVLAGTVDAQDDPLMLWCVGNAVVQRDGKDNIYPVKKKSRGRIDPVVALCIAWNLALRAIAEPPAEDPDLVVV